MKILALAASLRKESLNRKLLLQAVEFLKRKDPELEIDFADFREFEMPVYDGDLEASAGLPSGARNLIARLRSSDALVLASPEYNGGVSGALKNAIDWASRDKSKGGVFPRKPIFLMSASIGALGGMRGLWHARVPLEALGAYVFPLMFGLPKADQALVTELDETSRARLDIMLGDFLLWARKLVR